MADTITEALQELIEGGMGEGGLFPDVNGVAIGEDGDLSPNAKYPLIIIAQNEDSYNNNGNHITIERNFSIIVHVIDSDVRTAEKLRDLIILDEFSSPVKGIIPFFLQNRIVSVDSVEYAIEVLGATAVSGKDRKNRTVAAAEIPLRLERRFQI